MHMQIQIYIDINTHACMHAYIHTYIHLYIHTCECQIAVEHAATKEFSALVYEIQSRTLLTHCKLLKASLKLLLQHPATTPRKQNPKPGAL